MKGMEKHEKQIYPSFTRTQTLTWTPTIAYKQTHTTFHAHNLTQASRTKFR